MASPGQVVKVLAELTGIPEATITVHDRFLAEAGLRTQGGRGPSAAQMTARDVSRLVASILGAVRPRDVVDVVRRFERKPWRPLPDRKNPFSHLVKRIPELAWLPPDHSFVDAIEALIAAAANGSWPALDSGGDPLFVAISATSPSCVGELEIRCTGQPNATEKFYPIDDRAAAVGRPASGPKAPKFIRHSKIDESVLLALGELLGPGQATSLSIVETAKKKPARRKR